jgi:hypothetical protein
MSGYRKAADVIRWLIFVAARIFVAVVVLAIILESNGESDSPSPCWTDRDGATQCPEPPEHEWQVP